MYVVMCVGNSAELDKAGFSLSRKTVQNAQLLSAGQNRRPEHSSLIKAHLVYRGALEFVRSK